MCTWLSLRRLYTDYVYKAQKGAFMDDAVHLEDGLVVYTREGVYQMRLKIAPQKYIWRSLKTRNKRDAIQAARREYYRFEDKKADGLAYVSPTVKKVLADYEAVRKKDNERGKTSDHMLRQIRRVQKFWIEYIGNKQIDKIGNKELADYEDWRRDYYKNKKNIPRNAKINPTDKTLLWEITFFKTVIKWADQKGFRGKLPLPTYSFKLKKYRARPAIEMVDYKELITVMRRRIFATKYGPWRESRLMLRDYVLILANSGMRVGELNNLRFRDILPFKDEKDRENYRLIVRGKTGERDVIPRQGSKAWIDRAITRRKAQGAKDNDYLFVMPNGKKVITLIDQFKEVLKEAELETNSNGETFTLYSLRHHYAVNALRKGKGVFEVARNMGTSVQMINLYYGRQATSSTFATRLGD